jgi:hypothetical protein
MFAITNTIDVRLLCCMVLGALASRLKIEDRLLNPELFAPVKVALFIVVGLRLTFAESLPGRQPSHSRRHLCRA